MLILGHSYYMDTPKVAASVSNSPWLLSETSGVWILWSGKVYHIGASGLTHGCFLSIVIGG